MYNVYKCYKITYCTMTDYKRDPIGNQICITL